jgi:hypothetical protein
MRSRACQRSEERGKAKHEERESCVQDWIVYTHGCLIGESSSAGSQPAGRRDPPSSFRRLLL